MNVLNLLRAHRYSQVVVECQKILSAHPNDIGAMANLAAALIAMGRYKEALPLYERIDADERDDKIARGRAGKGRDISCIYWFLGDRPKAISLMRGLVEGILDGSIQYGDAAGGVQQGTLLYYMGITAHDADSASFALDYMRNRAKRRFAMGVWPGPVVRYYLRQIDFPELLEAFQRASGGRCYRARQRAQPSVAVCSVVSRWGNAPCGGSGGTVLGADARMLRAGGSTDRT